MSASHCHGELAPLDLAAVAALSPDGDTGDGSRRSRGADDDIVEALPLARACVGTGARRIAKSEVSKLLGVRAVPRLDEGVADRLPGRIDHVHGERVAVLQRAERLAASAQRSEQDPPHLASLA